MIPFSLFPLQMANGKQLDKSKTYNSGDEGSNLIRL